MRWEMGRWRARAESAEGRLGAGPTRKVGVLLEDLEMVRGEKRESERREKEERARAERAEKEGRRRGRGGRRPRGGSRRRRRGRRLSSFRLGSGAAGADDNRRLRSARPPSRSWSARRCAVDDWKWSGTRRQQLQDCHRTPRCDRHHAQRRAGREDFRERCVAPCLTRAQTANLACPQPTSCSVSSAEEKSSSRPAA